MKFNVSKTVLQKALALSGKCINDKSVIPVMAGFHFSIFENTIEITGGNMEVYLSTTIDVEGKGFDTVKQICVPTSRITSLLAKLPEQPIVFEIKEKVTENIISIDLVMKTSTGTYKIPVESGDDYIFLTVDKENEMLIPSTGLTSAIDKTLFACSTDDLRPNITGVNITFEKGCINYVATNTHIMSVQTSFIDNAIDTLKSYIVPPKVLSVLQTLELGPHVKTYISDRHIQFDANDKTTLKSILIDARYVDYQSILPKANDKNFVVDRVALLSSLKRVSEFALASIVKITIKPGEMQLIAENFDVAEFAEEKISIDYEGDELSFGISGNYLSKCISKYEREDIHFSLQSANRPMLIRSEYKDLTSMKNLMLIMPCILN